MCRSILDGVVAFDIVRIEPDDRGRFRAGVTGEALGDGVLCELGLGGFRGETLVLVFDDASSGLDSGRAADVRGGYQLRNHVDR